MEYKGLFGNKETI